MERKFNIIVAASDFGIGKNGTIPWRIKGDVDYFKQTTTETMDAKKTNCVIMGRKTYFSIPAKFRPLPGRVNIVVTTDTDLRVKENLPPSILLASSLEHALRLSNHKGIENVFVCGGSRLYAEALKSEYFDTLFFTNVVSPKFECDTFFPKIDLEKDYVGRSHSQKITENGITYEFIVASINKLRKF